MLTWIISMEYDLGDFKNQIFQIIIIEDDLKLIFTENILGKEKENFR